MTNRIFKARIEGNSRNGEELHITSYCNEKIHPALFEKLNNAVHDVVEIWNGKKAWRETYYKFTHNGKRYEQFEYKGSSPCDQCVFYKHENGVSCQHPYYPDKGYCGKPYRLVKE